MTPYLIGISGKTGAGKSTLSQELATALKATTVSWDDFDTLSEEPEYYIDWFNKGADYREFKRQSLADILQALKLNQSIMHPVRNKMIYPTDYIIFDSPLGRLHQQTGTFIDLCVHLEVPLDVSLSRRLLRDFTAPDKTKEDLLEEIAFYLSESRPLFFDEDLKQSADVVIDGMLSTKIQVQEIRQRLQKNRRITP